MVGKIIPEILGFELASFSDKNPDVFGSVIFGQKIQRDLFYTDLGIFLKNLILGTELASFLDKKTRTHSCAFKIPI